MTYDMTYNPTAVAWIETSTKGPSQRVQRVTAYRVMTLGREEIARFDVGVGAGASAIASDLARKALAEYIRSL